MASPPARPSPARRTSSLPTRPSVRSAAAVLRASFSPTPIAVASRNGSPHCTSKHGRSTRRSWGVSGQCGRSSGPSDRTGCSGRPSAVATEETWPPRPPRSTRLARPGWCPQTKDHIKSLQEQLDSAHKRFREHRRA